MYDESRLSSSDSEFKQYIADLKAPWKTMGTDMDTALSIISRHTNNKITLEKLELLSVSGMAHEQKLQFPDWQSEVEKKFITQYGLKNGKMIFKKVIMRIFLLARGTAQPLH